MTKNKNAVRALQNQARRERKKMRKMKKKMRALDIGAELMAEGTPLGNYKGKFSFTNAPVAKGTRAVFGSARIRNIGESAVVAHSELIQDFVSTGTGFSCIGFPINPGMAMSFPWLSGVAANYDSYRIRSLTVKFLTECSTTTTGSILIAFDPDAADSAPLDKQEMMSYKGAVRVQPWDGVSLFIDHRDLNKIPERYVRTGGLSSNLDIKTYDAGVVWIGQSNVGGVGTVLGEIHFEYEFELLSPQYNASTRFIGNTIKILSLADSGKPFFGSQTVTGTPFVTAAFVSGTTSTFTFSEPGYYFLEIYGSGGSVSGTGWSGSFSGPSSFTRVMPAVALNASTSDGYIVSGWVKVVQPDTLSIIFPANACVQHVLRVMPWALA